MKKEEFFYKPKTMDEIFGNKSKVIFTDSDIAECVLELFDNEGLLIPEIVPEEFDSRLRFLKRAPQVVLDSEGCKTPLTQGGRHFQTLRKTKNTAAWPGNP